MEYSSQDYLKLALSYSHKIVSSDLGSQTGQNIQLLCDKYSKQSLGQLIADKTTIKKARVSPLSENEEWKLKIIEEVSLILKGQLDNEFDDEPLLEEILEFVCTT